MSEKMEVEPGTVTDLTEEREAPRLISLLFIDFFNETKENKLNLFGIFDKVYVDQNEKKTTPIGVFVRLANTFGEKVNCEIYSPDNVRRGGFNFEAPSGIKLPDGTTPIQAQLLARIKFDAPIEGAYWVRVSYGDTVLGGAVLIVEHKDLKELKE